MKIPSLPRTAYPQVAATAPIAAALLIGLLGAVVPFAGAHAQSPPPAEPAALLRVGPSKPLRTLAAALKRATPGATIELEAGDYVGDVAAIDRDNVRIVGLGAGARFRPHGANVEGKGTLVVRAAGITIENVEITGTRVADHYGSAIRLERGSLRILNSRFANNELSIMTANDPSIELEIENCEFSGLIDTAGRNSALSHAVYAGAIRSLRIRGTYFHDGSEGHLLKSRARVSDIRYNRFTDENGVSSYEIEFPDGGTVTVVGNLIQQGKGTRNPVIVSYGAEGSRWPDNRLAVAFNTIVNDGPADGLFVSVLATAADVKILNNVWVGPGTVESRAAAYLAHNTRAQPGDFVAPGTFDYRPRAGATWVGSAVTNADPPLHDDLLPAREYVHAAVSRPLPPGRPATLSPGALQTFVP